MSRRVASSCAAQPADAKHTPLFASRQHNMSTTSSAGHKEGWEQLTTGSMSVPHVTPGFMIIRFKPNCMVG